MEQTLVGFDVGSFALPTLVVAMLVLSFRVIQDLRTRSSVSDAPRGKPRRVMIVANRIGEFNGETGGGSIFRENLFNGLTKAKYTVTCMSIGRADLSYYNSVRGPLMSASVHNIVLMARAVRQQDLVVISGSWTFMNCVAVYLSLLFGMPCITFVTMNSKAAVDSNFSGATWLLSYCLYMASDYFNCFLSTVAWTRSAEYLKILNERHVRVQGVVSCDDQYEAFRPHDSQADIAEARNLLSGGCPEKPLLLFCGRLRQEKRIPLLLAARPPNMVLAIVGNGTDVEYYKNLHNPAKGIVCLVEEMVPQARLRLYYKAADIHVSASDFETLGNTVHEALLCGCPAIVQRAGGYISQVRDGQNGYLVDWEDAQEAQRAVKSVLKHELTSVMPLPKKAREAMDIVAEYASGHTSALAPLKVIVSYPAICLLWGMSCLYERFSLESTRAERMTDP
mmetsp:Transcript_114910/g.371474  ORF Transcript_114910/g.371474 Transcript_114910/m.371474 type:complete len:450 (-) Transcript_114910:278-1627(-)